MSAFTYMEKDGKVFMIIGGRLKIRWLKRFVPKAVSITVLPSSITLSKSSYTIKVDGSYTLSATVLPASTTDKDVIWSSNDEEVATVTDGGKVTGIAEGSCKIIATCKADSSLKAECAMTVEAKEEQPGQ